MIRKSFDIICRMAFDSISVFGDDDRYITEQIFICKSSNLKPSKK